MAEREELGSNILHSIVLLTDEYEDASEKWHKLTRAGLEMADQSSINDPEHWRNRAKEMRALADQVSDSQTKSVMLRIAETMTSLQGEQVTRATGSSPRS